MPTYLITYGAYPQPRQQSARQRAPNCQSQNGCHLIPATLPYHACRLDDAQLGRNDDKALPRLGLTKVDQVRCTVLLYCTVL